MATRTSSNSGTLRKEKKAPSSLNSPTPLRQSAPKSAIPGPPDRPKSSPSSGKSVPNYLRPTVSSRTETLKNVRKPGNNDQDTNNQKASLLRRRSFDRPPPASRIQKAFKSPDPSKERPGSHGRTLPAIRCSSFSSRSFNTSPKPAPGRSSSSRLTKPANSPPPVSKSLNSRTSVSKTETSVPVSSKAPISNNDANQNLDLQTEDQNNEESLLQDETVNENEFLVPACDLPDIKDSEENFDTVVDTQVDNSEDEKLKQIETASTASEAQSVSPSAQAEETAESKFPEESENQHQGEENHIKDETSHIPPEDVTTDHIESKIEADQNEGEENANRNVEPSEETIVETKKEGEYQDHEASEEVKSKEGQDKAEVVEEAKPPQEVTEANATAANSTQKRQVGPGKKDGPAYNDVIEETKNKLLEKRKNKVKALVGAFETVIDYESAGSK